MNKEQIEKILDTQDFYVYNKFRNLELDFNLVKKTITENIIPNVLKDILDGKIKTILENLKNRDSKVYEFTGKNQEIYDKGQIDAYNLVLEKIKQKAKEDFGIEI